VTRADRDLDQPAHLDDPFVDPLEARAEDDEAAVLRARCGIGDDPGMA
jgi:hypothetical protein